MKKKIMSVLLCASMAVSLLVGCGSTASSGGSGNQAETGGQKLVGVAMPTKDLQRWNQDGSNMQTELEKAGYKVDLQYASNDNATMVSQIENMITEGVDVLVVASIDGSALGTVMAEAKEANIPVIAYDRLIMDTDAVSYYATFDNYMVGTKQGQYIEDALDLKNAKGPFNMEIFTGDPGDNNARFFYGGAMDILQPYIDKGVLVVQSGQTKFEEVATQNWSTEEAQKRMEAIIASNYADKDLDVVLCSNDSTALGVENALAAGYKGKYPAITGQDCDIANVKNLIAGKQSMSIFKDTRTLASQVVKMVGEILEGKEVEVNDTTTYDNGKGIVPSYLCEPQFADKNNYEELLIDSGYYKKEDLQ